MSFSYYTYLALLGFICIVIELFYSKYRKDAIYSQPTTRGNILNGLVAYFTSLQFNSYLLTSFILWYAPFNLNQKELNFLSFAYCLLLVDFCTYVLHYLNHRVRFLWMFHFVHHSDDHYNLTTYYRASWIQHIYGIAAYIPMILLGYSPLLILPIGLILSTFQFFDHSNYIKIPKIYNLIFITPNTHKIHHSQAEKYHNSNFGAVFSFWDRLFGTYSESNETITPGIQGYHQNNFLMMEIDPIVTYFKKTKHTSK